MKIYIVIEKWDESYENTIKLNKGQNVTIDLTQKNSDQEWKDWL